MTDWLRSSDFEDVSLVETEDASCHGLLVRSLRLENILDLAKVILTVGRVLCRRRTTRRSYLMKNVRLILEVWKKYNRRFFLSHQRNFAIKIRSLANGDLH